MDKDGQGEGLQAQQPTLVRKAYLSRLADDFRIIFRFLYGR